MRYKKETWLVFYRTKSGKLSSKEVDIMQLVPQASTQEQMRFGIDKEEAMELVKNSVRSFKDFEYSLHGPIVKKLCYI